MPLRNDLLNPISPDNPAGENLRYAPVYDKIKEARREDDDAPQGDWKFERKQADWALTIKLIGEALATKSKDLQLAAWLAEAMLRREGVTGLRETLDLIRGLVENFWDGLYPEIEDGDAEFRAAPLQWLGDRLELPVKRSPITKGGLNWLQFGESKKVGSEADADTYEKQETRQQAIKEGKLTVEDWQKDFDATPKQFYVDLEATFDGALESLNQLSQICDEKFGDVSPSFRSLQNALEEVRQTVHILLVQKREKEPDIAVTPPPAEVEVAPEPAYEPGAPAAFASGVAATPVLARTPGASVSAVPQSWEDACERVAAAAKYMREQDPYSPAPYLLLRGVRWGELRAAGTTIDPTKLSAPPTEIRQNLKTAALDANWAEVLEIAETAMAMECGRGWLDLQRYVARACESMGNYYDPIRTAIISEVKGLLADYPQLPELTMMDDTPTANAETVAWIKEAATPPPPAEPEPEPVYRYAEPEPEAAAGVPAPPDPFELALQAARSGRAQEGIELLMREMMQEPSGRGRFQRKVQVAQLCLSTGNDAIALPILQEAAAEIERRKLEDWETRETVAHPLAMLYRCLAKSDGAAEERQRLYSVICRLDPLAAMNIGK